MSALPLASARLSKLLILYLILNDVLEIYVKKIYLPYFLSFLALKHGGVFRRE